jgi:hypothetical protein
MGEHPTKPQLFPEWRQWPQKYCPKGNVLASLAAGCGSDQKKESHHIAAGY